MVHRESQSNSRELKYIHADLVVKIFGLDFYALFSQGHYFSHIEMIGSRQRLGLCGSWFRGRGSLNGRIRGTCTRVLLKVRSIRHFLCLLRLSKTSVYVTLKLFHFCPIVYSLFQPFSFWVRLILFFHKRHSFYEVSERITWLWSQYEQSSWPPRAERHAEAVKRSWKRHVSLRRSWECSLVTRHETSIKKLCQSVSSHIVCAYGRTFR